MATTLRGAGRVDNRRSDAIADDQLVRERHLDHADEAEDERRRDPEADQHLKWRSVDHEELEEPDELVLEQRRQGHDAEREQKMGCDETRRAYECPAYGPSLDVDERAHDAQERRQHEGRHHEQHTRNRFDRGESEVGSDEPAIRQVAQDIGAGTWLMPEVVLADGGVEVTA